MSRDQQPNSAPIKVAIIEDDRSTLRALVSAVEVSDMLTLVGSAATHHQAGQLVRSGGYDVLLVDLNLGHQQSFDLIKASSDMWEAKIVVISSLGDEDSVITAIEQGAQGYILKDGAFTDPAPPILQVWEGDAPISPGVARHLLRRFQPRTVGAEGKEAEDNHLSPRETQVLLEFARGASYKEVAAKFDISIHTVGDYVKTLYRKLQVNSRSQAVSRAITRGMIEL